MQYKEQINFNKLKTVRKSLGMTQKQVAAKLGYDIANRLSHWENGTAIPSLVNLFRLCLIYDTSPDQLYRNLIEKLAQDLFKQRNEENALS